MPKEDKEAPFDPAAAVLSMSIEEYLQHRVGLKGVEIKAIFSAIAEYSCLKFLNELPVKLPYLGSLKVHQGKGKSYYRFHIAAGFADLFRRSRDLNFRKAVTNITQTLHKPSKRTHHTDVGKEIYLRLRKSIDIINYGEEEMMDLCERNPLRFDFLVYLQERFPYSEDWVHPYTNVTYSWEEIKQTLLKAKELDHTSFVALYITWGGVKTRKEAMHRYHIKKGDLWKIVFKAVDLCLGLLILEPINELHIEKILNCHNHA